MRTITIPLNYCFYCFLFFLSASNVEGISMLDFINKSDITFSNHNFVEKRWDNNSGLPVNSLAHITLSDNGYLWIASFDGLIKYNGSNFSTISIESYPNLKSNRFIRVYQQSDGQIISLTQNGDLYLYNSSTDTIKPIPFPKSSNRLHVENIYKNSDGIIYAATNKGLWIVSKSDSLIQVNETSINEATFGIVEDQFSTLWIQKGYSSLFRITEHSFQVIQAVPQHNLKVLDVYNSKSKSYIASNRLLVISDSLDFKVLHLDEELITTQLTSVFVTKNDEKVLLGTYNNGFYVYNLEKKSFEPNSIKGNAFPNNHFYHRDFGEIVVTTNSIYDSNLNLLFHDPLLNIISALPDLEGGIWLATDGNGLIRLSRNRFFTYRLQNDLNAKSNNILSVLEDDSGKLWFGSYGDGIYTVSNDEIKRFSLGDGKHGLFNHSMYQSKTQGIFVASVSNGVYQIADNSIIKSTLPVSETLNINSAFEDYNHNLWLSTSAGLFLKSTLTPTFEQSEIISISSKTNYKFVFEAPDSSLWVSVTQDGLYQLTDYKRSKRIYANTEFENSSFRFILLDPIENKPEKYTLWVGTEGNGLHRIKVSSNEFKIDVVKKADGLFDDTIHNILADRFGRFWMATNRGLFYVHRKELSDFFSGSTSTINSFPFFVDDGLPNNEFNGGNLTSAIVLKNGNMIFANQKGAVEINPENFILSDFEPHVAIQKVFSYSKNFIIDSTQSIEIPSDYKSLSIIFSSISFAQNKKYYKYRLLPVQKEWTYLEDNERVDFVNLSPGLYTFEVTSRNMNGKWSVNQAHVKLRILPDWYESNWFFSLLILFLISSIILFVRIRYTYLRKKSNILQQLVDHKTEELEFEKAELKQKSVDLFHFIESNKILISNLVEEMKEPVNFISETIKSVSSSDEFSTNNLINQKLDKSQGKIFLIENILSSFIELNSIRNSNYTIKISENNLNHILEKFYLRYIEEFPNYKQIIHFESKLDKNLNLVAFFDAIHFQYTLINLLNYLILLSDEDHLDNYDHFKIHITLRTNSSEQKAIITIHVKISENSQQAKVHSFLASLTNETVSVSAEYLKLEHIFNLLKANSFSHEIESNQTTSSTILITIPITVQKGSNLSSLFRSELNVSEYTNQAKNDTSKLNPPDFENDFESDYSNDEELEDFEFEQHYSKKPRVLCIDDFKPFRILVRESLKNDFEITECESSLIALEKLRSEPHDIIITDYKMPGMDGIEFTKVVRKDPLFAGIPIIILSGVDQELSKKEALEKGADLFLNKPLPPALLLAQVKSIFEMKKRLRQTLSNGNNLYKFESKTATPTASTSNSTTWTDDLINVIRKNLSDANFNVADLAIQLNMDRSVLFRKTKKTTGKSPSYIIQEMRIQKAIDMLINDKATISEIAYACGYNSLSYFSQAFKTQMGKSPSEWLNRFEENAD